MGSNGATRGEVTRLLEEWRSGDTAAPQALFDEVYGELRAIASRRLARLGVPVIEPTELVHEAVVRLLGHRPDAASRLHFFRVAAAAIRCTLVDIVRRHHADKRGGGAVAITLSWAEPSVTPGDRWLDVEHALGELERLDARKCRVVELAWLVGLRQQEIAETLAISVATVERDLRFSRAWLRNRLSAGASHDPSPGADGGGR